MKILVLDIGGTNLKYVLMDENYSFLATIIDLYNKYKNRISGLAMWEK